MLRDFLRFVWKVLWFNFAVFFACAVLYLMFWPVPINASAWTPPKAPELSGRYARNAYLESARLILNGIAKGAEDVAVDAEGNIYGGMSDGTILKTSPDQKKIEVFAYTGGRPLGLDFDAAGNLIVADAIRGLLSVDPEGAITVLVDKHQGKFLKFVDDVDVAPSGKIYFSDASTRFGYGEDYEDVLEHGPNGQLLMYEPVSGKTRTILGDLYFANGVAVSPDESFVLVNETSAYRVRKVWLSGPKAGKAEVLIDNLPGFPDGISSNGKGMYWIALFGPRTKTLDMLLPRPFLRTMVYRLPSGLRPRPAHYGFVLGVDAKGNVLRNLQGPSGVFAPITSVEQVGDKLYLGSLTASSIAIVNVPE